MSMLAGSNYSSTSLYNLDTSFEFEASVPVLSTITSHQVWPATTASSVGAETGGWFLSVETLVVSQCAETTLACIARCTATVEPWRPDLSHALTPTIPVPRRTPSSTGLVFSPLSAVSLYACTSASADCLLAVGSAAAHCSPC